METWEQTSRRLNNEAAHLHVEELAEFLAREQGNLLNSERPFAEYLRARLREKGRLWQEVFLAADLSENYGYKLVEEEKHTRRRDVILRLCLAAGLTAPEINEALILYGMAPLHARFPRDAVMLAAAHDGVRGAHELDALLREQGMPGIR